MRGDALAGFGRAGIAAPGRIEMRRPGAASFLLGCRGSSQIKFCGFYIHADYVHNRNWMIFYKMYTHDKYMIRMRQWYENVGAMRLS
jgi:hypothetical protein